MTRMQENIQFWSAQAVSTASEVTSLLMKLADAQVAIADLMEQNEALKAEAKPIDPTVELRLELEAKAAENEALMRKLDNLTNEWSTQSQQLMALTMENERLRGGEPPAELEAIVPASSKKRESNRARDAKAPIERNCKACGNHFEVSFRNRLYCSVKCAPLTANGGPRRKVVA